jgi:ADP-heptose:LPS heptosyltransferase
VSEQVLVLRALGVGDLLTAVPALRALRVAYPQHRLVLAAPAALRDLATLTGAVDELLDTPRLGPPSWPPPPPAVAVNLHGRGPQSTAVLRALRPATLLAHAQPGQPGPPWEDDLHEIQRWCRLLEHFGIRTDPADLLLPVPRAPNPVPGAIIVHPGCGFAARQWPIERYAVVARRLASTGRPVVVTGNAAQRAVAEQLVAAADLPSTAALAGRTTLGQLAALVAGACLIVCGDTGIAHLATAYGTPSVVLFGPVSPRYWGPPPQQRQHVALWAGRTGDTFAKRPDPGLLRITPGQVIAAAEELLVGCSRLHALNPAGHGAVLHPRLQELP